MHVPINVKSPNNISEWQMGFNSACSCLTVIHSYGQKEILITWKYWTRKLRSRCPSGLWRVTAAACLVRLWVRVPAVAWMSVVLSVVCCQVEVSSSGWSLVQESPTDCGVSECDREAWIMRRPYPTRGCCAMGGKKLNPKRTGMHNIKGEIIPFCSEIYIQHCNALCERYVEF
jgi:hypothetical protein